MRLLLWLCCIVGVVGIYFLGSGITGFIAIEGSCCFEPNCPADYLCDAAKPFVESPSALGSNIFIGSMVVLVASIAAVLIIRHQERLHS